MDSSSPGRGSVATLAAVLLLLAVGIIGATGVASAAPETIYVDGGPTDADCGDGDGGDYDSIQNAVDNATAGDTVVVCGGTYAENVTVDKQLTIRANDGSDVALAGDSLPDGSTAITVESNAAGTVVEGLAVTGFDEVANVGASDTVVRDLVANDSDTGVAVSASGTATVSNVTVRNVTLDNVTTGVLVSSAGTATVSDVNVFRNLVNGSSTGISVDGDSSVPLEDVGIRQNLVANATSAGVDVTSTTDPAGVRVTRNFFQDNDPLGVRNANTTGTPLTAWLNHWGDDSGPGSVDPGDPVADPVTGTSADGTGNNVSANVHFDPWLGRGACTDPQLRNVTDRTLELFEEEVRLSELQPTCLWERAALPLRADDDDAATSVRNLQLFVRGESTADVPANRPRLSVYQQGESFDLRFESTTAADTSRFAGEDTQLLVVRGDEATTDFEVGLDNGTGEARLSVDAAAVSVVDTGQLDGDGELNHTFTPASAGDYTFVLVTNDFGPGVEVDGSGEIRVDGGISVVGVESVPVQNEEASTVPDSSVPAGSNVTFSLDSNLADATTNHSVLLYNESTFADQRVTIEVDGDVSEALSGDLSSSEVTIERSIRSVNGFIRADVGFSALGFEVDAQDRSGRVDVGPFLDVATSEFGVDGASDTVTSDAVVLNGSIVVVQSPDSDTTVDVETFANFSTGTYRYVYVAQQGSEVSSDTGEVELTTPTPTPTPTPPPSTPTPTAAPGDGGDGGDGGGGQPGGPGGEVEIRNATLLNGTVEAGQPVVVRVDLANFDPAQGRITLTMTADGEVVTERTVAVGASTERTVFVRNSFGEAGTFDIGLNGRALGTVTVTAAPGTPGETPTRSPTGEVTPTDTGEVTPTEPSEVTPTGTASPTGTLPEGPGAPTGTEIVITFVLVLALLAAVGVVVYVLPAGVV